MLAITANWGIGDGSLADSRGMRAAAWLEAIRRAIVRAGWGRDGRYRPVSEVTLLFAGDTFDWLLSDRWAGRDRPWQGGAHGEEARTAVAAASLWAARPVLRTVGRWARAGLPVPAATPRDRPSEWAVQAVRLQPVLLAGDRDAWLTDHAAAAARFGITTGEEWSDGRRHVRHGHDLDPLAHRAAATGRGGRQPTLAESLMTDLVVPFAVAVRGDGELWPRVRPRLAVISAAAPSQWPAVLAGIGPEERERGRIRSWWRRAVAAWHRAAVRLVPTCETEFDALGELAAWLDAGRADQAAPETIRRLDGPASGQLAAGSIVAGPVVAGPGAPASPLLACLRPDGQEWAEPLGGPLPTSPVVAVGGGVAGSGFIDAA
jgi:hypothetical protein